MPFGSAGIQESLPKVTITAELDGFAMAVVAEQLIGNPCSIGTVSGNVHRVRGGDARKHPCNLAAGAGGKWFMHGASNSNTTIPMNGSNVN